MKRVAPKIGPFTTLNFTKPEIVVGHNVSTLQPINLNFIKNSNYDLIRITILWKKDWDNIVNQTADNIMSESLREGTRHLCRQQIDTILDLNGAWTKFSDSPNHFELNIFCLKTRIQQILPVIKSIIEEPIFPEDRINKIIERKISEIKIRDLRTSFHAIHGLKCLIMGKQHPRAYRVTENDLIRLTSDDIEKSFQNNISSVRPDMWIAGNIDKNTITTIKDFAESLKITQKQRDQSHKVIFFNPENERHLHIDVPDSKQNAVAIGIKLPHHNHPDFDYLNLAITLLGGFFGSRLNRNIREEKGLTYGIQAMPLITPDGDICFISSQTTPDKMLTLINETKNELRSLSSKPITDTELDVLKRNTMTKLANIMDSPFSLMDFYIQLNTNGYNDNYLEQYQNTITHTNENILKEVSHKYLNPDDMYYVTAGRLV